VRLRTEVRGSMRRIFFTLVLLALISALCSICAWGQKDDPCPSGPNVSNAEMRVCYTRAQLIMNKRADDLAAVAAANLRDITAKEEVDYGPVVVRLLEDAAKKLDASQLAWRNYRDQYCNAIESSYTTGSGAGSAMEECLYKTAYARVRQLQFDFPSARNRSR